VNAQLERPSTLRQGGEVRAVLFDYGLTLVHIERPVEAIVTAQSLIAQCIEAAGHPRPETSVLLTAVHDRVEAEVAAHEATGALVEIDVAALEQRAFADIGLDLDNEVRDRCSRLAQEAWWRGVRVYPDAMGALRALRCGGLRLGVCSNAAYRSASMHEQLRHLGLDAFIDAAVFSAEVGWRKPSPQLFAAALETLGAVAGETVFVGDRMREDVGGAASAGMRTVLVDRSASTSEVPLDGGPDAVIRSLGELPTLLLDRDTVVTIGGREI
jgi:putative hydrolase of the HAD superfamily